MLEGTVRAQWIEHAFDLSNDRRAFPITPEIGNILHKSQRVRAFHITSMDRLSDLDSIQNSKKSISTTTILPKQTIYGGLKGIWHNGVVFYLEGTLLVKGIDDVMSRPDNEGRRWITFDYGDVEELWNNEYEKNKFNRRGMEINDMESFSKEQNEEIRKFLKDYVDTATKFAKQHRSEILQYFLDKDNTYADWDELVLNKIKLISVIWDSSYISDYAPTAKTTKELEIKKIESKLKSMVSGEVITVDAFEKGDESKIEKFGRKKTGY